MTIDLVPALFAVVGLIVYLAADGKASEVGRLQFFAGLLVVLLHAAGRAVTL